MHMNAHVPGSGTGETPSHDAVVKSAATHDSWLGTDRVMLLKAVSETNPRNCVVPTVAVPETVVEYPFERVKVAVVEANEVLKSSANPVAGPAKTMFRMSGADPV
jgi:hypothetical protein